MKRLFLVFLSLLISSTTIEARQKFSKENVIFIPNPPGTWRVSQSCAHRLAAYFGLGKGLDKVSVWAQRFKRVYSPNIGIAAIRNDRHHIIGIIGGYPGAWRVVDFNSGNHLNREYTTNHLDGYFFVDTRQQADIK